LVQRGRFHPTTMAKKVGRMVRKEEQGNIILRSEISVTNLENGAKAI
jgi:hypothetical protein